MTLRTFWLLFLLTVPVFAEHAGPKKPAPSRADAPAAAPKPDPEALSEEDELWIEYNENTVDEDPEKILLDTMRPLKSDPKKPLVAYDLGAGGGRDTMALLERNWKVIAIDRTKQSMEALQKRAAKHKDRFEGRVETFEQMKLAPKSADLINASYALPFMTEANLKKVMPGVGAALKPGGKFTGQFFNVGHGWVGTDNAEGRNFLRKDQVMELLEKSGLAVDKIELKSWKQGETTWKVYDVIATKK